jgi:hypothetical protein
MWFWKCEIQRQFGPRFREWSYCSSAYYNDSDDWLTAHGYILVCPD